MCLPSAYSRFWVIFRVLLLSMCLFYPGKGWILRTNLVTFFPVCWNIVHAGLYQHRGHRQIKLCADSARYSPRCLQRRCSKNKCLVLLVLFFLRMSGCWRVFGWCVLLFCSDEAGSLPWRRQNLTQKEKWAECRFGGALVFSWVMRNRGIVENKLKIRVRCR